MNQSSFKIGSMQQATAAAYSFRVVLNDLTALNDPANFYRAATFAGWRREETESSCMPTPQRFAGTPPSYVART